MTLASIGKVTVFRICGCAMPVGGDVVFAFLNSTKIVCFVQHWFGAVLEALSHSSEPSNASSEVDLASVLNIGSTRCSNTMGGILNQTLLVHENLPMKRKQACFLDSFDLIS